jgi:uncharacterized protein YggE
MTKRSRCLPLLTLLAACGGTMAGAQEPSPARAPESAPLHIYEVAPEQFAAQQDGSGVVEVSGTGSVTVSPDRAVVTFAVETRQDGAGDAAASNAQAMDAVISALRAAELPELTVETFGYSLQPEYGMVQEGARRVRVILGYAALNNIRVGVADVNGAGDVIDIAIQAGANRVSGLSFVASDTEGARQEALTRAVEQARADAATMAAALGHDLGPALEVRGNSAQPRPRGDAFMMRAEGMAEAATPIEAADQVVMATVTIKFALGPHRGGR